MPLHIATSQSCCKDDVLLHRPTLSAQDSLCYGDAGVMDRYVFSMNGPPSAEALTAVRAVLQAGILLMSSLLFTSAQEKLPQQRTATIPATNLSKVYHSSHFFVSQRSNGIPRYNCDQH